MQTITITLPTFRGEPAPDTTERVCRLCDKTIQFDYFGEGPVDRVALSVAYGTVHAACYAERIEHLDATEAWLIVAQDIARRPSRFTAAEIRAAFLALFRIARARDEAAAPSSALPPHDQDAYQTWVCPYCPDRGAIEEGVHLCCGCCGRRWDLDGDPLPDVDEEVE